MLRLTSPSPTAQQSNAVCPSQAVVKHFDLWEFSAFDLSHYHTVLDWLLLHLQWPVPSSHPTASQERGLTRHTASREEAAKRTSEAVPFQARPNVAPSHCLPSNAQGFTPDCQDSNGNRTPDCIWVEFLIKKTQSPGLRERSAVRSTCGSWGFSAPAGRLTSLELQFQEIWRPPLVSTGIGTHFVDIHTCRQKIGAHKIQFKNLFWRRHTIFTNDYFSASETETVNCF